jgi:hypothetical protein
MLHLRCYDTENKANFTEVICQDMTAFQDHLFLLLNHFKDVVSRQHDIITFQLAQCVVGVTMLADQR